MRYVRGFAALLALATIGFAAGDFASHPNALGALGLVGLVAAIGFLLSYLFRPDGGTPKPPPAQDPPPRERPRRPRNEPVWSGWDAEEARVAREQRREKRRG